MKKNLGKIWDKIMNHKNIVIYILMILVFILMFILNYNTPLIADDYTYSFNVHGERLNNIGEIFAFQYNHYMTWGGRTVNHFIGQVFLLLGKNVFNIANSLGYVLLTFLMYKHCVAGRKKESISLYILINTLLWIITPSFGQTFLWLIGSANYLWSGIIVLAFLLLFRKQATKEYNLNINKWQTIGIGLLGILAGWTNENLGIAVIAIIIMLLLYQKKTNNKKIEIWEKVGLVTCIIGYAILIAAPGNWIRSGVLGDKRDIWDKIAIVTTFLTHDFLPIILIYILNAYALYKLMKKDNKSNKEIDFVFTMSFIYLIGMLGTVYSMICSPIIPYRVYTPTTYLMIIALGNLYINLDFDNKLVRTVLYSFICVLSIIYMFSYQVAYKEIVKVKKADDQRIEYIEEQKNLGDLDIVTDIIKTQSKYCSKHNLDDLSKNDKKYWTNNAIAKYYGLNSILGK